MKEKVNVMINGRQKVCISIQTDHPKFLKEFNGTCQSSILLNKLIIFHCLVSNGVERTEPSPGSIACGSTHSLDYIHNKSNNDFVSYVFFKSQKLGL